MNNIIFLLTEGAHDSAFLYRILKSNNFHSYSKKIKDFPTPINSFLQQDFRGINMNELKINDAKSRILPVETLFDIEEAGNAKNLILIYSIGGDTKTDLRKAIIETLKRLNVSDSESIQAAKDTVFSVIYFFDADDEGTKCRLDQVKDELQDLFKDEVFEIKNKEITEIQSIKFGVHVFTEDNTDKGMLEDVLIPLMKQDNMDIFSKAEEFLSIHNQVKLFKEGLVYNENKTVLKKVNKQKYAYKKSLVGTVGQLQTSGKSNTMCIRETDYLNDDKITTNKACIDIYEFLSKVII